MLVPPGFRRHGWISGVPGAHGSACARGAVSASRGPGSRSSGVVSATGIDGGAEYIYRAASAAEFDPSWSLCASRGTLRRLRPASPPFARQVEAGLQLRDLVTLKELVAQRQGSAVFGSVVHPQHSGGAVVFSAAGLCARMAVAVARRTREIGIRIALGASRRRVLGSVFARAGRQLGGAIIACNSLILFLRGAPTA